jgi:hypothetical protein
MPRHACDNTAQCVGRRGSMRGCPWRCRYLNLVGGLGAMCSAPPCHPVNGTDAWAVDSALHEPATHGDLVLDSHDDAVTPVIAPRRSNRPCSLELKPPRKQLRQRQRSGKRLCMKVCPHRSHTPPNDIASVMAVRPCASKQPSRFSSRSLLPHRRHLLTDKVVGAYPGDTDTPCIIRYMVYQCLQAQMLSAGPNWLDL